MPKQTVEPWSLTSVRQEADQDRRQGFQPRPLRHLLNGRGRRVAADVQGTLVQIAQLRALPAPAWGLEVGRRGP